jgi:methenyltetrahydrofolate cyclohydrolase
VPLSDETIGGFLGRVAERVPAPGGASAAALHVALGAALLGMVARYTTGEQYAEHQEAIGHIVTEVDELRGIALRLAEADEDAFGAVARAYRLPSATDAEQGARSEAIARAVVQVAWPAARVISVAGIVVDLAEALAAIGNRNVIADVAAAAEAARAAAASARVSVEINLAGITDEQASLEMIADLGPVDEIIARAESLSAAVRERIRA